MASVVDLIIDSSGSNDEMVLGRMNHPGSSNGSFAVLLH